MALVASNSRSGSSGSHDSFVVTNVLGMERVVTKVFGPLFKNPYTLKGQ